MKTYFIGADVDSKMTELAFEHDGKVVKRKRVETSIPSIRQALAGVRGRKVLTLEEGPMANWLYRHLKDCVDELIVSDPRRNRLVCSDGDKDDPIDAGKQAELLRGKHLRAVYQTESEDRFVLRVWVGLYYDRVREAVRQGQKIRALGRRYLVAVPGRLMRHATLRAAWLAELKLPALAEQLTMLWRGYDAIASQVRISKARLLRQSQSIEIVQAWQALPGVGVIRAMTFYVYLDTPWRFRSPKALCKYCGIGLQRETSGTDRRGRPKVGKVRMPWACNRRLKNVSMGAAASAINQKDNVFAEAYRWQVQSGLVAENARHNVARKMVTVMWAMWKSNSRFDPGLIGRRE